MNSAVFINIGLDISSILTFQDFINHFIIFEDYNYLDTYINNGFFISGEGENYFKLKNNFNIIIEYFYKSDINNIPSYLISRLNNCNYLFDPQNKINKNLLNYLDENISYITNLNSFHNPNKINIDIKNILLEKSTNYYILLDYENETIKKLNYIKVNNFYKLCSLYDDLIYI